MVMIIKFKHPNDYLKIIPRNRMTEESAEVSLQNMATRFNHLHMALLKSSPTFRSTLTPSMEQIMNHAVLIP